MFSLIKKILNIRGAPKNTKHNSITSAQLNSDPTADFTTPDKYILIGFNKVFDNVVVSDQVKKNIFTKYREAHLSGNHRKEEQSLKEALADTAWSWPLFDKWDQSFSKRNQWPYMWTNYRKLKTATNIPPTTMEEGVSCLTGKEMRKILSRNKVKGRSKAITVNELTNMLLDNCTWEDINLLVHSKFNMSAMFTSEKIKEEKIRILCHTTTMTIYSLRDNSNRGAQTPPGFKYIANNITDCPVEGQFAQAYNLGKIKKIPPFFPGDRTSMRMVKR